MARPDLREGAERFEGSIMDKKLKHNRQKAPTRDELLDITPRGASFDTAEGRAAQGMKPDIGQDNETRQRGQVEQPEPPPAPAS